MKFQKDDFSCGVMAVINAAEAHGISLTLENVLPFTNTTVDNGTDERGIINALNKNNLETEEFNISNKTLALCFLSANLSKGFPAILCIDEYEHWITVIGKLGDKYIIFDSENDIEGGLKILDTETLINRWFAENKFYGIVVKTRG